MLSLIEAKFIEEIVEFDIAVNDPSKKRMIPLWYGPMATSAWVELLYPSALLPSERIGRYSTFFFPR